MPMLRSSSCSCADSLRPARVKSCSRSSRTRAGFHSLSTGAPGSHAPAAAATTVATAAKAATMRSVILYRRVGVEIARRESPRPRPLAALQLRRRSAYLNRACHTGVRVLRSVTGGCAACSATASFGSAACCRMVVTSLATIRRNAREHDGMSMEHADDLLAALAAPLVAHVASAYAAAHDVIRFRTARPICPRCRPPHSCRRPPRRDLPQCRVLRGNVHAVAGGARSRRGRCRRRCGGSLRIRDDAADARGSRCRPGGRTRGCGS